MSQSSFHPFSNDHWITLGLGFLLIAVLLLGSRKSKNFSKAARNLIVFFNLSAYPFALYAWRDYPRSLDNLLPFHLCDLTAIVAGIALLTRKPMLLALTYYWGLAATMQALLTPAINIGAPHLPFIHFFIQHFATVAASLYIPLVMGWKLPNPWWLTPLKVLGISIVYQGAALLCNLLLKTNFAFTLRPPDNPSLIDHLGPWPIYLFAMQGIAFVFYMLLSLPIRKNSELSLQK